MVLKRGVREGRGRRFNPGQRLIFKTETRPTREQVPFTSGRVLLGDEDKEANDDNKHHAPTRQRGIENLVALRVGSIEIHDQEVLGTLSPFIVGGAIPEHFFLSPQVVDSSSIITYISIGVKYRFGFA